MEAVGHVCRSHCQLEALGGGPQSSVTIQSQFSSTSMLDISSSVNNVTVRSVSNLLFTRLQSRITRDLPFFVLTKKHAHVASPT